MITAIIPTRKGDDLTANCIESLLQGTRQPNQLVIVSDGEPSAALIAMVDALTQARLLSVPEGTGFSGAVNRGLDDTPAGNVLVVNNDCRVDRTCLKQMERTLTADPLAAAVSPLVNDGGKCSTRQPYVQSICKGVDSPPEKRVHVPWTCLLLRREALDQCGHLDAETFPTGLYADDEWNLRATQAGWHLLLDTLAFAEHPESTTFKRLGLDYAGSLSEGRSQWLKRTETLVCVLGCDRKSYSTAGIESARRLRWVGNVHHNYEGAPDAFAMDSPDSLTAWDIGYTDSLPRSPRHDQDQHYRLPRIVAARNMCLDIMRIHTEYTHLLFIDSDVSINGTNGLEKLLLSQRPLIGGLVHGRGEHSHAEVVAGTRTPYHGHQYCCDWGSCGYQLIARPLCERFNFRWGRSRLSRSMRSEDPAFAEDVRADGWGRYVIDPDVTAEHVDNAAAPLTMHSIAEF
jgi:GT2 family glycosyltransferase